MGWLSVCCARNAIWIPQWPWSFVTLLATLLLWRPWWWRWSWGHCKMQQVSKCSDGLSKHVRTSLWMYVVLSVLLGLTSILFVRIWKLQNVNVDTRYFSDDWLNCQLEIDLGNVHMRTWWRLQVGINIQTTAVMTSRTFSSALMGFIRTIRLVLKWDKFQKWRTLYQHHKNIHVRQMVTWSNGPVWSGNLPRFQPWVFGKSDSMIPRYQTSDVQLLRRNACRTHSGDITFALWSTGRPCSYQQSRLPVLEG